MPNEADRLMDVPAAETIMTALRFEKEHKEGRFAIPPKVCKFEGEIIEFAACLSCPEKNVHHCEHPSGTIDRCRRGYVRGAPEQVCYRCPLRVLR